MLHDGYYDNFTELDGVPVTVECKPAYYDNETGESHPEFCGFYDENGNLLGYDKWYLITTIDN